MPLHEGGIFFYVKNVNSLVGFSFYLYLCSGKTVKTRLNIHEVCSILWLKKDGIKFGFYDIYLYICIVIMA